MPVLFASQSTLLHLQACTLGYEYQKSCSPDWICKQYSSLQSVFGVRGRLIILLLVITATMIHRELFSEMPYAAALNNKHLSTRCSACFAPNSAIPCGDDGCRKVVYCSDKCREIDQPNHTHECTAFKKSPGNVDQFIRLLGRILTRRSIDNGVVHLCRNFPKNVPDRSLADLMSHQREIEGNKNRSSEMRNALKEFRDFFGGTPLVDDQELIKKMYCTMWINCFSVSGPLNMTTGSGSTLGLGFYLNISRFNHSCRPKLLVRFDDARLIIQYPSTAADEKAVAEERSAMVRSAKKFNRLTISYGYSSSLSGDAYFPLRSQRRESLSYGYYFECRCVLCSDPAASALEEHAAAIECVKCAQPYVWKVVTRKSPIFRRLSPEPVVECRKTCKCGTDARERELVKTFVKTHGPGLKAMEEQWTEATSFPVRSVYANEIIDRCEPVWKNASRFWHPTDNLRMTHLQERLFISYNAMVKDQMQRLGAMDHEMLRMALKVGELFIAWYTKHGNETCDTATAAYGYELARLYEAASMAAESTEEAVEAWKRASSWFLYAAEIWSRYGDMAASFVQQLLTCAQDAQNFAVNATNED